jgi:hypothetical protein
VLANSAGRILRFAEQPLSEPQRQALLADSGRALQQQARGKCAARDLFAEPIAQRIVTNQW